MQDGLPFVVRILIGLSVYYRKGSDDLSCFSPPLSLSLARFPKQPYKLCRFRLTANFFDKGREKEKERERERERERGTRAREEKEEGIRGTTSKRRKLTSFLHDSPKFLIQSPDHRLDRPAIVDRSRLTRRVHESPSNLDIFLLNFCTANKL